MIQILILDRIQATKGIILIYNLTLDRKSCLILESL
ncbi:N-acetyltransferase ESCO1, partial [Araneus ventricosus]